MLVESGPPRHLARHKVRKRRAPNLVIVYARHKLKHRLAGSYSEHCRLTRQVFACLDTRQYAGTPKSMYHCDKEQGGYL